MNDSGRLVIGTIPILGVITANEISIWVGILAGLCAAFYYIVITYKMVKDLRSSKKSKLDESRCDQ